MTKLRPVVMSGPSGCGKSTLVKRLMSEYEGCFAFSVSHTTRQPRPGEVDGKDYNFVTRDAMLEAVKNNEFIEHAEFSGNMYGTSKKAVEDVMKTGRICILDIDMQGVKSVKQTNLNPRYIFIKPPCIEALEERLKGRGTETEASMAKRLASAAAEIEFSEQQGSYDHVIVNDDLEVAYSKLHGILSEEIEIVKGQVNQTS